MIEKFAKYADRAAALLAVSGSFASKAKQKEALDDVNRAYEAARDAMMKALLEQYPPIPLAGLWLRAEPFEDLYWGAPHYPHQWNEAKHPALFKEYPEFIAQAQAMKELRAAIKEAPIDPKPVKEDHPLLVLAKQAPDDFQAKLDRIRGQYQDALDLGRMLAEKNGAPLEGLPVYVNRVWCQNYAGTVWVRLDWFLQGQRKPFSVIAAAYQKLVDEGVIKEEEA